MDVLSLILACSLYPDDQLVRVLIHVASQENPYFVGDAKTLATYDKAASPEEAQQLVVNLLREGGRPAVGLMGLPVGWASRFGKVPGDMFDACTNISLGTAMLSHLERQCRAPSQLIPGRRNQRKVPRMRHELVRPCVLRRLGDELGIQGFVAGVTRAMGEATRGSARREEDDPAQRSPVFVDGANDSDVK